MTDGNIPTEQPTVPNSVSSILFTSTKPSISIPVEDTHDDESEATADAFDDAREVERRRAPHSSSQVSHGINKKPFYEAYVVFNGRDLGIFYNW